MEQLRRHTDREGGERPHQPDNLSGAPSRPLSTERHNGNAHTVQRSLMSERGLVPFSVGPTHTARSEMSCTCSEVHACPNTAMDAKPRTSDSSQKCFCFTWQGFVCARPCKFCNAWRATPSFLNSSTAKKSTAKTFSSTDCCMTHEAITNLARKCDVKTPGRNVLRSVIPALLHHVQRQSDIAQQSSAQQFSPLPNLQKPCSCSLLRWFEVGWSASPKAEEFEMERTPLLKHAGQPRAIRAMKFNASSPWFVRLAYRGHIDGCAPQKRSTAAALN